uniref:Uncharacterized protein n=1 Tax=Setaria digitata TaxID=48799 RepID=A0A915PMB7_9BILA
MFIHFQIFILLCFIGQSILIIAHPVETDSDDGFQVLNVEHQPLCLICQAKQEEHAENEDEINLATLYEYDKTMGVENLDEIENEMLLINSTAWLQKPVDLTIWKEEVAKFRDTYQKFEFDEANKQLETLKMKANAFALEKDINKRNALKKWRRLPVVRLRIQRIEQSILDIDNFGANIHTIQHIDKIRNLTNEVTKILQEVYDYYNQMDAELSESHNTLTSIEEKLNAKREKDGKFRRSKCFWIFCY